MLEYGGVTCALKSEWRGELLPPLRGAVCYYCRKRRYEAVIYARIERVARYDAATMPWSDTCSGCYRLLQRLLLPYAMICRALRRRAAAMLIILRAAMAQQLYGIDTLARRFALRYERVLLLFARAYCFIWHCCRCCQRDERLQRYARHTPLIMLPGAKMEHAYAAR